MKKIFDTLMESISKIEQVHSIGKTGSKKILKSVENDVDVFVFCIEIPDFQIRKNIYSDIKKIKLTETQNFKSKHWGSVDILEIDGIEICLIYFSISKTIKEIDIILYSKRAQISKKTWELHLENNTKVNLLLGNNAIHLGCCRS